MAIQHSGTSTMGFESTPHLRRGSNQHGPAARAKLCKQLVRKPSCWTPGVGPWARGDFVISKVPSPRWSKIFMQWKGLLKTIRLYAFISLVCHTSSCKSPDPEGASRWSSFIIHLVILSDSPVQLQLFRSCGQHGPTLVTPDARTHRFTNQLPRMYS